MSNNPEEEAEVRQWRIRLTCPMCGKLKWLLKGKRAAVCPRCSGKIEYFCKNEWKILNKHFKELLA